MRSGWVQGNCNGPLVPMVRLVPMEKHPIPMVLSINMFMSDKETFKLLLFFHGNGCNPEIISGWILLAQSWASSQATAEKRARQIQFVNDNVDIKCINGFTTTLIIAN